MIQRPNPYDRLAPAPSVIVTSRDVQDAVPMPLAQASGIMGAGGTDTSPQLSWSGFPANTASFAVTCYDPDAPTPSGFWHWAVCDIPADVAELGQGAGDADATEDPDGSLTLVNDAGMHQYLGAAPPEDEGAHRYYFVIHAVDLPTLGAVGRDTPFLAFNLAGHTLARALIVPVYEA